jgi:hypothetical protein
MNASHNAIAQLQCLPPCLSPPALWVHLTACVMIRLMHCSEVQCWPCNICHSPAMPPALPPSSWSNSPPWGERSAPAPEHGRASSRQHIQLEYTPCKALLYNVQVPSKSATLYSSAGLMPVALRASIASLLRGLAATSIVQQPVA